MPSKPKALVFDSWAIIAYLGDEPEGEKVARLISEAVENAVLLWMSVVNVGEVWNIIARKTSTADADTAISELQKIGIQFDNAEWKLARQAAMFKSRNKMTYADAFAAALAIHKNAHLVTGDKEFKQLEGEVKILWL